MLDKRLQERSEKEIMGITAPSNKRPEITNLKLSKALSYYILKDGKNIHDLVQDMLIQHLCSIDDKWTAYFENDLLDFEVSQQLHFFQKSENYTRPKDTNKKQADG